MLKPISTNVYFILSVCLQNMIQSTDWFHLQWILLYSRVSEGHTNDISIEIACRALWDDLSRIGRKKCTYDVLSRKLRQEAVVLLEMGKNVSIINPCIRQLVFDTIRQLKMTYSDIRLWNPITSKIWETGTEYLVQHVAYETSPQYFCSAFSRGSWEKPLVFWFLNPLFRGTMHKTPADTKKTPNDNQNLRYDAILHQDVMLKRQKRSKGSFYTKNKDKQYKAKRSARSSKYLSKTMHKHHIRYPKIEEFSDVPLDHNCFLHYIQDDCPRCGIDYYDDYDDDYYEYEYDDYDDDYYEYGYDDYDYYGYDIYDDYDFF